ncbi:MAG: hypothetical protein EXR90_03510 [Methyloglobulus sp.]|nr:hypothetical protein [Methyloglobulus sp.]
MIDIGSTNFLIKVPGLPEDEFERYSTKLFDEWDRVVEQTLDLADFIRELKRQFENAPLFPKQLSLIDEERDKSVEKPIEHKKKTPRTPQPKPTPIPQHYRIEIWRESKKDQKPIKITKL